VSEFGLHSSKEGPAAFPLPRLVALVEVGTHVVPRPVIGALAQAEVALAEELLPTLTKEMLLIEDRGFVGYEWWARVKSTGADILCRVRNNMRFPRGKRLADGSCISYLPPPKGVDGEKTPVRVIEYALKAVPGSEASYRIITTILDQETAPARELAALYHERWEAQSLFDEFKTHMRGGSRVLLRSKTPDLVRQEVYGLLLAHYAVRVLKRKLPQAAGVFSPTGAATMVPVDH